MARFNNIPNFAANANIENANSFIIVNGVRMPYKDYLATIKAKKAAAKATAPKERKVHIITDDDETAMIPDYVKGMIKQVDLIKSLFAYYDNAYKQWGTVANEILNNKLIERPFIHFRCKYRDVQSIMADITKIGKNHEKDVYYFVRKLSWNVEELMKDVEQLMDGVSQSGVLHIYGKHECINGAGRRLGLRTLMQRTFKNTTKLLSITNELNEIADGKSIFKKIA